MLSTLASKTSPHFSQYLCLIKKKLYSDTRNLTRQKFESILNFSIVYATTNKILRVNYLHVILKIISLKLFWHKLSFCEVMLQMTLLSSYASLTH